MRKPWLSWLGHAVLIAALPLALLSAVSETNEYRAMGIDAVDCDGPLGVLIFAVPAGLIYGSGAIVNARRFRCRRSLVVAWLCGLLCVPLAINIAAALEESGRTAAEDGCRSSAGAQPGASPPVASFRRNPVART